MAYPSYKVQVQWTVEAYGHFEFDISTAVCVEFDVIVLVDIRIVFCSLCFQVYCRCSLPIPRFNLNLKYVYLLFSTNILIYVVFFFWLIECTSLKCTSVHLSNLSVPFMLRYPSVWTGAVDLIQNALVSVRTHLCFPWPSMSCSTYPNRSLLVWCTWRPNTSSIETWLPGIV